MNRALEQRLERIARSIEVLTEQISGAALPLAMSKVRAARELDVSVTTLTRLIRRGELRLNKAGKVPASELLRYAAAEGRAPLVSKQERYDARAVAQSIRENLKARRAH